MRNSDAIEAIRHRIECEIEQHFHLLENNMEFGGNTRETIVTLCKKRDALDAWTSRGTMRGALLIVRDCIHGKYGHRNMDDGDAIGYASDRTAFAFGDISEAWTRSKGHI